MNYLEIIRKRKRELGVISVKLEEDRYKLEKDDKCLKAINISIAENDGRIKELNEMLKRFKAANL